MSLQDSGDKICKYCWGRFKAKDVENMKRRGGYVCKNCKGKLQED